MNPYFASCCFCLYHWRVTNFIDLKYLKDSVEMTIWNLYWKEVVPMFAPMDGSRHVSLNPMETECGPPVSIWNILKSYWPEWGLRICPICKRKKYSLWDFFICLTHVHRDRATLSMSAGVTEPSNWFRENIGQCQNTICFHGGGLSHQLSSI